MKIVCKMPTHAHTQLFNFCWTMFQCSSSIKVIWSVGVKLFSTINCAHIAYLQKLFIALLPGPSPIPQQHKHSVVNNYPSYASSLLLRSFPPFGPSTSHPSAPPGGAVVSVPTFIPATSSCQAPAVAPPTGSPSSPPKRMPIRSDNHLTSSSK